MHPDPVIRKRPRSAAHSANLAEALGELLDDAKIQKEYYCDSCGALMTSASATVWFDGESWELPLPVCRHCHPDRRVTQLPLHST